MFFKIFETSYDAYMYGLLTSYVIELLNVSSLENKNVKFIESEINKDILQIIDYENDYVSSDNDLYKNIINMKNKLKKMNISHIIKSIIVSFTTEEKYYEDLTYLLDLNSVYKQYYILGFFDANGSISNDIQIVRCRFISKSEHMCKFVYNLYNIPFDISNYNTIYTNSNCIDFLNKLYTGINFENDIFLISNYQKYLNFLNWKLRINILSLDVCKVYKDDPNAIFPTKSNISDVGYDLTIIKKIKNLTNTTILYDTGIKISLAFGYYAEIVPRSSLSKSGFALANSIGIIENSYTGNLFIALTKTDLTILDLQLPFKCCQLIFKPQIFINLVESSIPFDNKTIRGNGGFGSTNK